MLKSPIARKLNMYFTLALLMFSLIIGCVFVVLFRNHTINLQKTQLTNRAVSMATTLLGFMEKGRAMSGYGGYMRFLGDIAGSDVWIIDREYNLLTPGRGQMQGGYTYGDLPTNAEEIIEEVFADKKVFSEGFSEVLSKPTLTVGVPIKSQTDGVIGVVLLHSPVNDADLAIGQGIMILSVSITLGFLVSFVLSLWLSKRFTDPIFAKEAENALATEKIRRDFVANVSHELKTPVTVLRGSLEALTEKVVTDPAKVEDYHIQMLAETKFLERLVGDLLELSRLQNMDFAIEKREISICDVLSDVARSAEQLAIAKNITIKVTKTTDISEYKGDYGRLRQMLMIVLNNAIKFSNKGGIVEIKYTKDYISVKDNGIGISKEHLPHIFDRFYKSHTEDNKTGTGLGLAIALQIAIRHNIKLTAHNNEDGGAIFTFWL